MKIARTIAVSVVLVCGLAAAVVLAWRTAHSPCDPGVASLGRYQRVDRAGESAMGLPVVAVLDTCTGAISRMGYPTATPFPNEADRLLAVTIYPVGQAKANLEANAAEAKAAADATRIELSDGWVVVRSDPKDSWMPPFFDATSLR